MIRTICLKLPATLLLLLGVALLPVACGADDDGGAAGDTGNDGGQASEQDTLDFALEQLPELDEEHQVLPHILLDEEFELVDGETYALQGRVKDMRDGIFAVQLVDDTKVDYNPAMPEPWIYCCTPTDEVQENLISVRFVRDGEEMPVRQGEFMAPSFRLVDLITVVGTVIEQSDGTPVFLATGYVIDERPELGDHVEWPES